MAVEEFGIDQGDENVAVNTERFKADKRKYRISFAAWHVDDEGHFKMGPEDESLTPRFLSSNRNYLSGIGYVLNKGKAWTKAIGEKGKRAVGTVIVIWPTDLKGNIRKELLKDLDAIQVKMWVFGKDKYRDISSTHREWPLNSHDLTLDCTETQYQRMTFTPCRQSLLRKFKESDKTTELYAEIEKRAKSCWEALPDEIGQELSPEQILAKKSGDGGSVTDAAVDAVADEEVDEMLDEMI